MRKINLTKLGNMDPCIREPYVAGKFYPESKQEIIKQIKSIQKQNRYDSNPEIDAQNLIGVILPHAGHMYSGYQTIPVFEILKLEEFSNQIDSIVILHPIHQGGYHPFSCGNCSTWLTPLGEIQVDTDFLNHMEIDRSDHLLQYEHSAEVLIPFIQYFGMDNKMIIPIGISHQNPDVSREISRQLREVCQLTGRRIFIIASSDFSHFLSAEKGFEQDDKVIHGINKLDIESIYHEVQENNISVCGYGPIMTLIDFAFHNSTNVKSKLLARGHSGQVYPSEKVVDYISILFYD